MKVDPDEDHGRLLANAEDDDDQGGIAQGGDVADEIDPGLDDLLYRGVPGHQEGDGQGGGKAQEEAQGYAAKTAFDVLPERAPLDHGAHGGDDLVDKGEAAAGLGSQGEAVPQQQGGEQRDQQPNLIADLYALFLLFHSNNSLKAIIPGDAWCL